MILFVSEQEGGNVEYISHIGVDNTLGGEIQYVVGMESIFILIKP